ncbi:transcription initiation factor-like protein (TFIID-like protein) [Leptomonas seymouri]|uniref:TATA box-binding protein-like 1 n=1 Tax=Leptomonas seymouri TaxID=5684 RepID=A0A0N1HSM2_LEPSE|nr:transcription initiation factor-like protein (TFIID-like protein) [Leptomonas seymouri]|eukprot:KPI83694.1 transcription initiation factor-like protein (TFIID-like protein) [Leptomonas seymouri]
MDDDFDDFFNEGFDEETHDDAPFEHSHLQLGSAAAGLGEIPGLDDGTQLGPSAALNADGEEIPPPIVNIQEYLPNVSPDAFPVVVAVQAQASIAVGIDLAQLSCATRNVEYMPNNRIPSATMRLHEPTAVVMVHNSGALNIIGAASVSEARQAAELAARIIRKALNLEFSSLKFRVRSITARFNVCSPVRLNELARYRVDPATSVGVAAVQGSYEPERFNGCVLRFLGKSVRGDNQWSVSCSVFVTGKVQLMGARSMDELRFAFHAFIPVVAQYLGTTSTSTATS